MASFAYLQGSVVPPREKGRMQAKTSKNPYYAHTITTAEERQKEALKIREAKFVIRGGSAEVSFDGEQPEEEVAPSRRRHKGNKKIAWGGGKASDEAWARSMSTPRLGSPRRSTNGPLGPGFSPGRNRDLDLTIRSMQVEQTRLSRMRRAEARRPHTARSRTSLERSIDADIADRQLRLEFLDRLDDLRSEHARNQAYLKRLYEEKAKRKLNGNVADADGGRPAFMSRDDDDKQEEKEESGRSTRRGSAIYQSEYEDDFEMAEDEQIWNEMENGAPKMGGGAGDKSPTRSSKGEKEKKNRKTAASRSRLYGSSNGKDIPTASKKKSEDESEGRDMSTMEYATRVRHQYLHKTGEEEKTDAEDEDEIDGAARGFERLEARGLIKHKSKSLLEYEEQRRSQEEEEIRHLAVRFKAQSIPATTTEPLYRQLQEAADARRRSNHIACKERLEQSSRPFLGMERREEERKLKRMHKMEARRARDQAEKRKKVFKANPIPRSSLGGRTYSEIKQQEDAERRARMAKRSAELLKSAQLPMRMEMHAMSQAKTVKPTAQSVAKEMANRKRVAKKVPNFARQHELFKAKLAEAKMIQPSTTPVGFAFDSTERKQQELRERERKRQRAAALEAKRLAEKNKREIRMRKLARKARDEEARKKAQGVVSDGPKMTKKFEEAVARRKRLEEEEIERKREQEAVILRRQEKAARVAEKMNKIVEEMERRRISSKPDYVSLDDAINSAGNKAKKFKEQSKKRALKNRQRLRESLERRANLMERTEEDIRKQRLRQEALKKVARIANNATRAIGDANRSSRNFIIERTFDDEEKDSLMYDDEM